jgi:hypothetical protein
VLHVRTFVRNLPNVAEHNRNEIVCLNTVLMWADNFPEIFYAGNVFYLIMQFVVPTNGFYYATLVCVLCAYHIKHNITTKVPYWRVKLIFLSLNSRLRYYFEFSAVTDVIMLCEMTVCVYVRACVFFFTCACSVHEITSMPRAF